MGDVKVCNICKVVKELSEFYKDNSRSDGTTGSCVLCLKETRARFYQKNKERLIQYKRQYYATHKKDVATSQLKYYQNNRDKIIKQNIKSGKLYKKRRRDTDPLYRLVNNHRSRVYRSMKHGSKSIDTITLLGCTGEALRNWLSYQFEEGMSWTNYGKWHIDHVKPCASFNMKDPEQQSICHHWTNLQPLWAKDNLTKGDTYVV